MQKELGLIRIWAKWRQINGGGGGGGDFDEGWRGRDSWWSWSWDTLIWWRALQWKRERTEIQNPSFTLTLSLSPFCFLVFSLSIFPFIPFRVLTNSSFHPLLSSASLGLGSVAVPHLDQVSALSFPPIKLGPIFSFAIPFSSSFLFFLALTCYFLNILLSFSVWWRKKFYKNKILKEGKETEKPKFWKRIIIVFSLIAKLYNLTWWIYLNKNKNLFLKYRNKDFFFIFSFYTANWIIKKVKLSQIYRVDKLCPSRALLERGTKFNVQRTSCLWWEQRIDIIAAFVHFNIC